MSVLGGAGMAFLVAFVEKLWDAEYMLGALRTIHAQN